MGDFFSNFVVFLQYLNFKEVIDAAYDVPSIARDLDWIAVMSYDYHGSWNKKTGHVSPMYDHPDNRYDTYNTVIIKVNIYILRRQQTLKKNNLPILFDIA